MTSLIHILIIFFVCLIGYQLFLALSPKSPVEGMTNNNVSSSPTAPVPASTVASTGTGSTPLSYTPYGNENEPGVQALALSRVNEDNIQYLKQKIEDLGTFNDQLNAFQSDFAQTKTDFTTQLDQQQQQISELTNQASTAATGITGGATSSSLTSDDMTSSLDTGNSDPVGSAQDDIDNGTEEDTQQTFSTDAPAE